MRQGDRSFGTESSIAPSHDLWIAQKIGIGLEEFHLDKIRAYQFGKVQETLQRICQHSPFYRKHLEGFLHHKPKALDDFDKFPTTTAQDLRRHGLEMLCVSQSEIQRVVTLESSGTTGEPKRLYFTQGDQALTLAIFGRGMATFTFPGERVLVLLPCDRPGSIGDLLATAITGMGGVPIRHGMVRSLAEAREEIAMNRADVIVGIPNQVLALAKYDEWRGRPSDLSVKRILLSTDFVSCAVIQEIRRIWGAEVYRYYGMTEMGLGGGIECSCHAGYHLHVGDFWLEIIDLQTGKSLPTGQFGEVVMTTLTRTGMPLFRYRTGDYSRLLPSPCPCGSVLPRLDNVRSRVSGHLYLGADLTLTMAELDELLLALPGVVDFQARLTEKQESSFLSLDIQTFTEEVDLRLLQEQLGRHSTLEKLQQQGRIHLRISIMEPDEYKPAYGKRVIRRSASNESGLREGL